MCEREREKENVRMTFPVVHALCLLGLPVPRDTSWWSVVIQCILTRRRSLVLYRRSNMHARVLLISSNKLGKRDKSEVTI